MPIKFLLLWGGGVLGILGRGGGSANFIFMGAGIFPNKINPKRAQLCTVLAHYLPSVQKVLCN